MLWRSVGSAAEPGKRGSDPDWRYCGQKCFSQLNTPVTAFCYNWVLAGTLGDMGVATEFYLFSGKWGSIRRGPGTSAFMGAGFW